MINQWDPRFLQRAEIFSDLSQRLGGNYWDDWPRCTELMTLLDQPIILASGLTLKMVPQDETLPCPQMGYEERIFRTGLLSTRERNWHDLFNAFIWLLFPQTKVILNEMHLYELSIQPGKQRTHCRDMITHLDESGVIIASTDTALLDGLKNHQWEQVFIQARPRWEHQIAAFVFGHGMYEKALHPFIGFTGKAYCMHVDEAFFKQEKLQQYRALDPLLADEIKNEYSLSRAGILSPLPILGVPHWYAENENPGFYANKQYFRDKRT